jgi:hypothetical protein
MIQKHRSRIDLAPILLNIHRKPSRPYLIYREFHEKIPTKSINTRLVQKQNHLD